MFYLTWMYSLDARENSQMFSWIQVIENNVLLWAQAWKKTEKELKELKRIE